MREKNKEVEISILTQGEQQHIEEHKSLSCDGQKRFDNFQLNILLLSTL